MNKMKIVTKTTDGNATLTTVDLLEDYWADFLASRKDALISARNDDTLRTHRFLRSGLFAFINYLAGLANRWQINLGTGNEDHAALSLADRLTRLADRFQADPPPRVKLDYLMSLSARCSDLQPSDEVGLYHALSLDPMDSAQREVIGWLEGFVERTGLPLHGDTRSFYKPLLSMLGEPAKEDYHDFEALGDDPHPFQDPPGTWDVIDPDPDTKMDPK